MRVDDDWTSDLPFTTSLDAPLIPDGGYALGDLFSSDDTDSYRVSVLAGASYVFTLRRDETFRPGVDNAELVFHNSDYSIYFTDQFDESGVARVVYWAETDDELFLDVMGWSEIGGGYRLEVLNLSETTGSFDSFGEGDFVLSKNARLTSSLDLDGSFPETEKYAVDVRAGEAFSAFLGSDQQAAEPLVRNPWVNTYVNIYMVPGVTAAELELQDPQAILSTAEFLATVSFIDSHIGEADIVASDDGALFIEVYTDPDQSFYTGDYFFVLDGPGSAVYRESTELGGVDDPFAPSVSGFGPFLIAPGEGYAGNLAGGGDEDKFSANFSANSAYVATLVGIGIDPLIAPSIGTSTAISFGPVVSTGFSAGPHVSQSNLWTSEAGDVSFFLIDNVYTDFRGTRGGNGGDYRFSLLEARAVEGTVDEIPGSSGLVAGLDAEPLQIGEAVTGGLQFGGDADEFRLTTPGDAYFMVTLAASGPTPLTGQTLRIRREDATTGETAFIRGLGTSASYPNDISLSFGGLGGDNLIIDVSGFDASRTGDYLLSVVQVFDTVGDDVSTSASITTDKPVYGVIEAGADEDWFRTTFDAGTEYTVSIDARGFQDFPPALTVRDASGSVVESFAKTDYPSDLAAVFTPTFDGIGYITVGIAGTDPRNEPGGDYYLSLAADDSGGGGSTTFLQVTGDTTIEGDAGGGGTLDFVITRSGAVDGETTVNWHIEAGSADASDVVGGLPQFGTSVFATGERTTSVSVDVAGDDTPEFDEDLMLIIDDATGDAQVEIVNTSATGTIENDDELPSVSVEAVREIVVEGKGIRALDFSGGSSSFDFFPPRGGNGSGDALEFRITRDGPVDTALTVDYSVVLGDVAPRQYVIQEWQQFNSFGSWSLTGNYHATATTATTFAEQTRAEPDIISQSFSGTFDLLGADAAYSLNDSDVLPSIFSIGEEFELFSAENSGAIPASFTGGVLTGNYESAFDVALDLAITEISLGEIDIVSSISNYFSRPSVVTAGESYALNLGTGVGLYHSLSTEPFSFGDLGIGLELDAEVSLQGLTLNAFGSEVYNFGDVNLLGASAYIPLIDLLSADSFEFEVLDGVIATLQIPDGSGSPETGRGHSPTGTESVSVAVAEEVASLEFQFLEILDNAIPALDLFQEDETIMLSGAQLTLNYVLLNMFARLGYNLVSEYVFTPELTVTGSLDGNEFDLSGGSFSATAPGSDSGSIDGSLSYALGGTLSASYSLVPIGSLGFEALKAEIMATENMLGSTFHASVGPLFGSSVSFGLPGTIDLFEIDLIELSSDLFTPVEVYFSIPVRAEDKPEDAITAGSITFAPGETEKIVTLDILRDSNPEANQDVLFRLDAARTPGGGLVEIVNGEATATVVDDDDIVSLLFPRREFDFWGDPHIVTIDGLAYDFQTVGEFTIFEAVGEGGFTVQGRTAPTPGSDVASQITAIATEISGSRIMIDITRDTPLLINGVETTVDLSPGFVNVGDGAVYYDGQAYVLQTAAGDEIMVGIYDGFLGVCFFLSDMASEARSIRGLFGDGDGDRSNDIALPDGTVIDQPLLFEQLYGDFADAWRVTDETSLFHYEFGESTADFTDFSFPRFSVGLDDLPADVVAAATAVVDALEGLDPGLRDSAILDYALTGNLDYVEAAGNVAGVPLEQVAESESETPPLLGVSALTPLVSEADGELKFLIWRTGPLDEAITVGLTLGGNVAGVQLPPESVQLSAGEDSAAVTLAITPDDLAGPDRDLELTIIAGDEALKITSATAMARVLDDDTPALPGLSLEAAAESVNEEETVTFGLSLTSPSDAEIWVDLGLVATPGSTAVDAADLLEGVDARFDVVFAPGETEKTVTLLTRDDQAREDDELLTLRVLGVIGAESIVGQASTLVVDNDSNNAPVATPLDPLNVDENAPPVLIGPLDSIVDPDGGALTVEEIQVTGELDASGALTQVDGDIVFDAFFFAGQLGAGDIARFEVSWTAKDAEGATVAQRQEIAVNGLTGPFTFYEDNDRDAFGGTSINAYSLGEGIVAVGGDPDDNDPTVFPVPPNDPPTANPIDAGIIDEDGAVVSIDLLADASATDIDGGVLGVADVAVEDANSNPVAFGLLGSVVTLDPSQFAATLNTGDNLAVNIVYKVTDGQGGSTPNIGALEISGLDGPFTWFRDGDGDGIGVDNDATNQTAYEMPEGTAAIAGDLDDGDDSIFPGASEINDGKDNDQDGETDEDNTAPVAQTDSFTVAVNSSLKIAVSDLLANDADAEGDSLKVVSVSAAENGSVQLDDKGDADSGNDEIAFTPNAGFTGGASFEYTLSDGFGGTDSGKVNLDVLSNEPSINSIIGTAGSDYLVGTNDPDLIRSLAGSYDRMLGGAGEDIFVFGEETYNGIRERDVIMDYEVGVDTIVFDNATDIGSIRATSTGAVIFMNDDLDAIYVIGQGVTPDNLTISTDLWL
ncbi:Ig-like domain-containing protein [Methylomonas rivi]|uniref:Cadherin-like domain-containing protein n=1 Tax=Methylomonas rivi TaxID=2952226 RepID=A0ABT1U735_9GAMM|nr:cadherin-like domain-containing protein [Methylomonas sp. WSC-6]MCQ8129625.1 cadherin-like domain-containing protein [Methylomonas sp. WSC-6]